MSTFEYLAIAFSLVLSFGAMRIIAGLPSAFQVGRRYWVHLSVTLLLLLTIVLTFWTMLSYRDASWTLPRFMLALASPALLFFGACTLIPDDASSVASWREYFYSVRQRYWIATLIWVITIATNSTVILGVPWDHPSRLAQGFAFLFAAIGATSASERVQSTLAVLPWTAAALTALTIASQPGFLAR